MSAAKRIVHNTILLYIRQILVLALGLYTTRLTLQILGVEDFGVYAAVAGFTSLLSILTNTLSSGAQRFITIELGKGNFEKLNKVYITSVNIQLLLSLILIIMGETIGVWFVTTQMTLPEERMMTAFWIFQIALFNSVLSLVNTPSSAVIVAHEDLQIIAVISILESALRLLAVVSLFHISWDKLIIYAIVLMIVQCVKRFSFFEYCRRHYIETKYRLLWDRDLFQDMLHISGWIGLTSIAISGFIQGVNVILNIFFGPVVNAAYSVSMQAYSGVRAFCSNFQLASNPQIVKLYSIGDYDNMQRLLFRVCKMSFFLIFTLSLPFVINSDSVILLWLGRVPEHSKNFLILLFIYAYIDVFAYPLDTAAHATGLIRNYCIILSIGVLSTLPIAYVAYLFGAVPEAIYWIAITVALICIFVRLIFLSFLLKISILLFIKEVLGRVVLTSFISVMLPITLYLFAGDGYESIILNFIITYFTVVIIVYYVGLNNQERFFVLNEIKAFRNKISTLKA